MIGTSLEKGFETSSPAVFCLSSSLDTQNFYAVLGSCAFKAQAHQAYSGLPVSHDVPRIQPQFLRLGFSACPLTAQDFLRIELAYDVQRGEWIETTGSEGHAAFPLLCAIARAHTPQLMAYRSAWLQAVQPSQSGVEQSSFLAHQAASIERLRMSMADCFAARNSLEIDAIMARHQRLCVEQRLQHQAFRPLERSLFRLDVRALTVYFELLADGPAYFFEYSSGLSLKEQILLEPLATGYVVTLLSVMRPAWLNEAGLCGQVRLRACPTGYDRSVTLRTLQRKQTTAVGGLHSVGKWSCGGGSGNAMTPFPRDVQVHFDQIRDRPARLSEPVMTNLDPVVSTAYMPS